MAEVPSTEQLVQDIAWLKRLATMLANDRDDADDLVQETWIAAWRRQPDASRPMRGWLTKVVRDVAGMKHRSDRRRAARDALAEPQAPAAPDELLAQIQLHKLLAELVIELDEPYRSTIIARFVEGRTSASIAKSLGIPAGTVRKRLHEALSRLRAKLDANAGDRKQWAPAVLAFAKGGFAVAKPTKLVVVVLVALLLVGAVMIALHVGGGGTTSSPAHSSETTASSGVAPSGSSASAAATDARAPLQPITEQRTAERTAMLAAIAKAREGRAHSTAPAHTPAPPVAATTTGSSGSGSTTLDIIDKTGDTSDWSKRALRTLNTVLGQCYDLGLAEDPKLTGVIMIEFTLVGEPDVGGLLEKVDIVDAETTIKQQTIRDCLTQQLYALELDPPADGVTIKRAITLQVP